MIKFEELRTIEGKDADSKTNIVIGRTGEFKIIDDNEK